MLSRKPGKGFNFLSVSIGLVLLSCWMLYIAKFVCDSKVRAPHYLLFAGFGAIFTLFVIRVTCALPSIVLPIYGGIGAGLAWGPLFGWLVGAPRNAVISVFVFAVPAVVVGGCLFLLLRRVRLGRLSLRREELAVIYTILIIGTATSIISRSCIHSAANWWRDEFEVEKWLPPHFLPAPSARDDVEAIAHKWPVEAVAAAEAAPEDAVSTDSAEDNGPKAIVFEEKGAKKGMFEGRAKVPWWSWFVSGYGHGKGAGHWTFPVLFWTITLLTFEFFFLFVALVFRRRWIEEERMPFPLAQMPLTIIGSEAGEGRDSFFDSRIRWIAFALGLAACVSAIASISPTGGDGVSPLDYLFFEVLQTKFDLTGYLPDGLKIVWVAPVMLLALLFVPLEVLSTALLTFLLTYLALHVFFTQIGLGARGFPGYITRAITVGGATGLVFWTLVFQYKEIERLFSAFIRRTRSPLERRLFNARNILLLFWVVSLAWAAWVYPTIYGSRLTPATRWLMLIGTGFMFLYIVLSSRRETVDRDDAGPIGARSLLILLVAMGLSFIALTLPGRSMGLLVAGAAVLFVYAFASMRVRGDTVQQEWDVYRQGRLDATLQARFVPGPADPALGLGPGPNRWWNTAPGVLSQFYGWQLGSYFRLYAPHNSFMDTFKIGHEAGASARDILKAVFLAMVVASLFTPLLTLHMSYTYGFGGSNVPTYWYYDYMTAVGRTYVFGTSAMEPPTHYDVFKLYGFPVAAFWVIGVIMYMRREYVWFPLHPVGFLLGSWLYQAIGGMAEMWFTLAVAYAIKRVIFKWFGVRFFREKVQPVLVFALMGSMLGMLLYLLRYAVQLGVGIFKWS